MNQQQIFAERLARINGHIGNTNAALHLGMDGMLPQAALICPKGKLTRRAPRGGFLMVPVALIAGAMAWLGAIWLRVSVLRPETAEHAMAADVLGALVLMMLLWVSFGLSGRRALVAQLAGVTLMAFNLHTLVHLWPDSFAPIFPAEWMAEILRSTEPMTLALASVHLTI